jgi:hypothetical protein
LSDGITQTPPIFNGFDQIPPLFGGTSVFLLTPAA